jgi:hypothetical protein
MMNLLISTLLLGFSTNWVCISLSPPPPKKTICHFFEQKRWDFFLDFFLFSKVLIRIRLILLKIWNFFHFFYITILNLKKKIIQLFGSLSNTYAWNHVWTKLNKCTTSWKCETTKFCLKPHREHLSRSGSFFLDKEDLSIHSISNFFYLRWQWSSDFGIFFTLIILLSEIVGKFHPQKKLNIKNMWKKILQSWGIFYLSKWIFLIK